MSSKGDPLLLTAATGRIVKDNYKGSIFKDKLIYVLLLLLI